MTYTVMFQENNSSGRKFVQRIVWASVGLLLTAQLQLSAQNILPAQSSASDKNSVTENKQIEKNVMEIENACKFTSTVYAWLRNDIPYKIGYEYWRDIHGTLISRIPGKCIYRQLHMAPVIDIQYGKLQKYVNMVPISEQVQGIAHSYYLNEDELGKYRQHRFTRTYMLEDEPNLVSMNASLWSTGNNAKTLKDNIGNIEPQGKPANDEFVVSFIFNTESNFNIKKEAILLVSNNLAGKDDVIRVRYHLLEDYDDEKIPDTQVSHCRPKGVRYNAWIELAVQPKTDIVGMLEPVLSDILSDLVTIHIQPIFEKYTIVAEGKPTIVGLKGFPAYQTILAAGATNQLNEKLLFDIYGSVPRK